MSRFFNWNKRTLLPEEIEEAILESLRCFPSMWSIERVKHDDWCAYLDSDPLEISNLEKGIKIDEDGKFWISDPMPSTFNSRYLSKKGLREFKPIFKEYLRLEKMYQDIDLIKKEFKIADYIKRYI